MDFYADILFLNTNCVDHWNKTDFTIQRDASQFPIEPIKILRRTVVL